MAIPVTVVGLGRRGQEWVRVIRATPGFDLVAGVDVSAERRQDAVTGLGIPAHRCYGRLEDALHEARPQAVIVATSINGHVEPCRMALATGLGVLVEKPFTLSLREARQLVAAAEAARIPLVVGQNYRYMRMPQTLRRLFAGGTLGRIGMVVCQAYRAEKEASPVLATLPNSILWEIAVHHLDALRYALGQRVTGVLAERFTLPWSPALPGASLQTMIEFEAGTRLSYCATYDSRGHEFFERGQEFYLRAVTERGTLHVFHRWLVWCERGKYPRLVRRGPRRQSEETTLLDQLARALATGEEPECSGRDNLQTVAVLEACERSAATGGWVRPQELFLEPI